MNIYKQIAKDLREVKATQKEARLAFVNLQLGGLYYLHYIENLKERRAREAAVKRDA